MPPACPRCLAPLGPSDIDVVEQACALCRGVFLAPGMAARILDEQGFTPAFLGELKREVATAQGIACLGCGRATEQIPLRGWRVDLCPGCGALWLDGGELGALTGGKYENGPLASLAMERAGEVPSGTRVPVAATRGLGAVAVSTGVSVAVAAGVLVPLGVVVPELLALAAVAGVWMGLCQKRIAVNARDNVLEESWGTPGHALFSRRTDLGKHRARRIVVSSRRAADAGYFVTLELDGRSVELAHAVDERTARERAALFRAWLGIPVEDARD